MAHRLELHQAPGAFRRFDERRYGYLKVVLSQAGNRCSSSMSSVTDQPRMVAKTDCGKLRGSEIAGGSSAGGASRTHGRRATSCGRPPKSWSWVGDAVEERQQVTAARADYRP